jgi:meso-butanediol dehydrogenase/(S,S)-butanediol dehydrogenase/diacetyl reductase
VAAVTGASRGTGLALARALAGAGARVALLSRPSPHLEEAAASIEGALAVPLDVADPQQVRGAFETVSADLGRLDVLVNNAAVGFAHRIEDATDAEIAAEVGTNFVGPLYCIRAAVPLMRAGGGGTIVNVSSESSADPFPYLVLYGATKAALEVLSRGLLAELRKDGIGVTLLVCGHTRTGGFSATWDPAVREAARAAWEEGGYLQRIAGSEPQEPEDVATALLFVLSRPSRTMVDVIWCRAAR